MKMNDVDKIIWNFVIDSFTTNWILLQYNKRNTSEKGTNELINKSLMRFFINGLIEPLYNDLLPLTDWQLTKAGKFVKNNFILL